MTFPVIVHQNNGHYIAALLGAPDVCFTAATRADALKQLQASLDHRHSQGELVFVEVPSEGILEAAGTYRDDPFLSEIREEIYRERDAEPKE